MELVPPKRCWQRVPEARPVKPVKIASIALTAPNVEETAVFANKGKAMTLTHFLQMSLVYPRTHQLILRLLLEEPRFVKAFTGAHFEIGYVVKLEAENGIYDLGLYANGNATFFVNCKPKALRIFKVNQPAQIIEMNYEHLTGPLEVYLWNGTLAHRNLTVNEKIALHYYRAIHLHYLMPPQGDSLAIN